MKSLKTVSSLLALMLTFLFAAPLVFAQASAETDADAQVSGGGLMRQIKSIKQNAQDAADQLRANTKLELQEATTGAERREIMKGAAQARIEIAGDRRASTTEAIADFKGMLRIHGGVIKNRFRLALLHFNNLLGRIDSRLAKMSGEGIDVETAAQLDADAKIAVAKAQTDAKAVADYIDGAHEAADRSAVRKELQTKMKTADASLKAAHQAILKTVRALSLLAKDARLKADATVSATTSVQ